MCGKGDRYRSVDREKWDAAWDRIEQEKKNDNTERRTLESEENTEASERLTPEQADTESAA